MPATRRLAVRIQSATRFMRDGRYLVSATRLFMSWGLTGEEPVYVHGYILKMTRKQREMDEISREIFRHFRSNSS